VFELVRLGADTHRISVVPCGVDLSVFRPDAPSELRPAGGRLVVLSRLVERKGIASSIEAIASLPGVELVVAGGPPRDQLPADPEGARLLSLASRLGVEHRVDLRGRIPRDAAAPLLRSADAVVCVPWYEPFGIVPLEAMACGVPVIASAVGGLIDTVVHEQTGLHVTPRRPDMVAAAAARLLGDDELRGRLGRAAAERARRGYGWDSVAEATLRCYGEVLSHAWQRRPRRVAAEGARV
jgi:glycosyltransferase involved in cell wall biosynthesis